MTASTDKIEKVHFRIDFGWFTDWVRRQWAEGNYPMAITLLTNDCGIDISDAHNIIRGKLKMVPYPADPNQGTLAEDNWQPDLGLCYMGRYPDPLDFGWFKLINRYGVDGLSRFYREAKWAADGMNNSTYSLDKIEILKRAKEVPEEIYTYFNIPDPKTISTGDLYEPVMLNAYNGSRNNAADMLRAERLNPKLAGVPSVEEFVKQTIEFDKAPKPEPDVTFSRPLGWIDTKGRFYSCEYMQHRDLLDKLHLGLVLEHAVEDGWIEITHPLGEPRNFQIYYGNKQPTEAQLGTLAEWQLVYEGKVANGAGEW